MNEQLLEAVKTLHIGKVVAHPTETCYGLAVDVFQKAAVNHLYHLKRMPLDKPVSVLVRDLDEAQQYGEFSTKAVSLALQYWPGPLTIVVPRKPLLPKWINLTEDTVGFRVSSHKKTKQLVEAFGGPLTTTSANLSTQPQTYSVQDFLDQGLAPDYIWDVGRIGEVPPSTIVKVIGDEVTLIRQGTIRIA